MADVVKLSSLSIRFSSSSDSSLISLQPAMALAPARKFDKKICSLSNSSFEAVSGLALRPRKQLESFKEILYLKEKEGVFVRVKATLSKEVDKGAFAEESRE